MARIRPLALDAASPVARAQLDEQVANYGHATNMKRTLAHSPTAMFALMRWYDLHAEVNPVLGDRLTTLFAHAVSTQADCLVAERSAGNLLPTPWVEPEDMADAVVFLASHQARFMTGSQFVLDAGLLTR